LTGYQWQLFFLQFFPKKLHKIFGGVERNVYFCTRFERRAVFGQRDVYSFHRRCPVILLKKCAEIMPQYLADSDRGIIFAVFLRCFRRFDSRVSNRAGQEGVL